MEAHERIRYLRRDVLHMTMDAFGKEVGVSRDVINNMERNRLANFEQKLPLLKLIALKFGIREAWLLTGDEPMMEPPPFFSFDKFFKDQGATDLEKELIKSFFSLSKETRWAVTENFYNAVLQIHDARYGGE